MIEFSDGPALDSSGPLRVEEAAGQFYVLGDGNALALDSREAAEALLRDVQSQTVFLNMKTFKSPGARYHINETLAEIAAELEDGEEKAQ